MDAEPLPKEFLLKRGYCCGSGCKNCPYEPKCVEGNRKLKQQLTLLQ